MNVSSMEHSDQRGIKGINYRDCLIAESECPEKARRVVVLTPERRQAACDAVAGYLAKYEAA
jgi:hypothetical protein